MSYKLFSDVPVEQQQTVVGGGLYQVDVKPYLFLLEKDIKEKIDKIFLKLIRE